MVFNVVYSCGSSFRSHVDRHRSANESVLHAAGPDSATRSLKTYYSRETTASNNTCTLNPFSDPQRKLTEHSLVTSTVSYMHPGNLQAIAFCNVRFITDVRRQTLRKTSRTEQAFNSRRGRTALIKWNTKHEVQQPI